MYVTQINVQTSLWSLRRVVKWRSAEIMLNMQPSLKLSICWKLIQKFATDAFFGQNRIICIERVYSTSQWQKHVNFFYVDYYTIKYTIMRWLIWEIIGYFNSRAPNVY